MCLVITYTFFLNDDSSSPRDYTTIRLSATSLISFAPFTPHHSKDLLHQFEIFVNGSANVASHLSWRKFQLKQGWVKESKSCPHAWYWCTKALLLSLQSNVMDCSTKNCSIGNSYLNAYSFHYLKTQTNCEPVGLFCFWQKSFAGEWQAFKIKSWNMSLS